MIWPTIIIRNPTPGLPAAAIYIGGQYHALTFEQAAQLHTDLSHIVAARAPRLGPAVARPRRTLDDVIGGDQ